MQRHGMNTHQLKKLRETAKLTTEILRKLYDQVEVGTTGIELDEVALAECRKHHVEPAFYDVEGKGGSYGHAVCIGINDDVVHGKPTTQEFKRGDIITIDFGIIQNGLFTDTCVTFALEEATPEDLRLLEIGRMAIVTAARKVSPNISVGDIGHTIQTIAEMAGYKVVREYVGHGIGDQLHLPPEIPALGYPGQGEILRAGEVITVEAQINAGSDNIKILKDGWSVKTVDGKYSVMYEYMVEITKSGNNILTPTYDWPLVKK